MTDSTIFFDIIVQQVCAMRNFFSQFVEQPNSLVLFVLFPNS